jgi:hypothetical protein
MEWVIGMYVYQCTGGLLTDTDPASQIPHFLTANHCISTTSTNLETWFNYTTDSCEGMCPHSRFTGGTVPPSDTVGFTVLVSNPTSDATLGTLTNGSPPAGAVYLGWDATPIAFTDGAPLYRISNANGGPQVWQELSVNQTTGICGTLPRGNFIYSQRIGGSQMGGSSGAPVVNNAGEVVGQLYGCCGQNCGDYCDFATNQTVDGAFAATFCSVADFLDPGHGCCDDAGCDDGIFCNGPETCDLATGLCQPGIPLNCDEGKWEQLPDLDWTGMDVDATLGPPIPHVLADDFECTVTGPVPEIVVWGSWFDDYLPFGIDPNAVDFLLSIHEDIPVGPDGWSVPGAMVWQGLFLAGSFEVELYADRLDEWWWAPPDPAIFPGDSQCWMYRFNLEGQEFYQEGTLDAPVTYWLDVQAVPDDPGARFGWKTSQDHWNDDAVFGEGTDPPPVWYELRYPLPHPLEGQSIDLAFRIAEPPMPDPWYEDFESYVPGMSLHNQGGWRGWDGSAGATAYATDVESHSPFLSVDVAGGADLVQHYFNYTAGEWTYTAWMYVPDDFQSVPGDNPGSFFILLNTYHEGGTDDDFWSVQLHADSISNTFIRDGVNETSLPLITGEWVKLQVLIDLYNDEYRVLYNGVELGVAESWTQGIFQQGGGSLNIGAVDLFANGSSSVYWDDLSLEPGFPKGACCYESQGYPVCVDTDEIDCCCLGGIFQGDDKTCPTENVTTADHVSGPFSHLVDPAIQCPAGFPRGGGCPGWLIDPWMTAPEAVNCHDFGVPGAGPLPADFFGPGSDPFDGQVCLEGEPLGPTPWGDYETADTLIERPADPFDRCELPSGSQSLVDVEIVALNLRSVEPITVTYNGGQMPEQWDVTVDLSAVTPPVGTVTATKTHCNGGTYGSELNVMPRFTFTGVVDPGTVRVLDTGLVGMDHITLSQTNDHPWTSDVSENLYWPNIECTDFHPGIEDTDPVMECDCNENGVRDKCDIEGGGSPDANGDGIPDECALQPPALPVDDTHQVRKHRYISIDPKTNPLTDTVIKVEVAELRRCENAPTRGCLTNAVRRLFVLTRSRPRPAFGVGLASIWPRRSSRHLAGSCSSRYRIPPEAVRSLTVLRIFPGKTTVVPMRTGWLTSVIRFPTLLANPPGHRCGRICPWACSTLPAVRSFRRLLMLSMRAARTILTCAARRSWSVRRGSRSMLVRPHSRCTATFVGVRSFLTPANLRSSRCSRRTAT